MADVEFHINKDKLWRLVCKSEGTYQIVRNVADQVESNANSLSAGYRTGYYHKDHKSPAVGGTQPSYQANTGRPRGTVPVGIVYTGNYAAQKDNLQHNTLLKSLYMAGGN